MNNKRKHLCNVDIYLKQWVKRMRLQKNNHNWAVLRWKQTGEQGFTPNTVMDNVFMAAAMDDDIDLHPKVSTDV